MTRLALILLCTVFSAKAEVYCFGFLNAHPERKEIPEAQAMELQKGHLAHMEKMAMAGHLLAAGPMATPGGPRGVVIYRCQSLDEAREWTSGDPAVQNKRLTLELWRWQGPDGIGEPLMTRLKADAQAKYEMVRLPLIVLRGTDKWSRDGVAATTNGDLAAFTKIIRAGGPILDTTNPPAVGAALSILVFEAIPLEQAKAHAEQHPLVQQGYAKVDGWLWTVANDVIPKTPR